jgi:hypothetical protein
MSELVTVLAQLKKDFVHYDQLWEQAKEIGNDVLADMLHEELIAVNEMINEIEKEEIERHRRAMSTQKWRDFHVVK